ncbi:glyoxylase I 4 [Nymphaea colorata]|nr:glyoxylase I 4 [Nymphaea colorata]
MAGPEEGEGGRKIGGGDGGREGEKKESKVDQEGEDEGAVPLVALNHVSRLSRSIESSVRFYEAILGFVCTNRPQIFDAGGAWLFNYGVGIHLLQSNDEDVLPDPDRLDPVDNHISFQCENMDAMEKKLKDMNVNYIRKAVGDKESGTKIDQLFFNDPDGYMIEICNCENLELVPQGSLGRIRLPTDRHTPPLSTEPTSKS